MFFIAGTQGDESTVATGYFYCPNCNERKSFHHNQVHEKATLFFIPVANLRLLGEYIECQSCGNTYNLDVLDYDPEEEQQEFEALYLAGIKKAMSMMMLVDGEIHDDEIIMMKDIYKKLTGFELSDREIEKELQDCKKYPNDLEEYLKELFSVLNDSGREMIIKVAYWISMSDGNTNESENKLLKKIATYFKISNAHLKGVMQEADELLVE